MADSPFETVALGVIDIFNAEFAAEGFQMVADDLHESMGRRRVDVAIAPSEDVRMSGNALVQETWVEVKFYDLWSEKIDPATVVNPFKITAYAERFRRALQRSATDPATGMVWYFDVMRIQYPRDPTGNKSRFVATIRAYGNNSALVETTS